MLTIEGLAQGGVLHRAAGRRSTRSTACNAAICTPGMITRAYRLLQGEPEPDARRRSATGISGNLCRCTGYQNIVKAVQSAAAEARRRSRQRTAAESIAAPSPERHATSEARSRQLQGMGCVPLRKEDARFIRGQGNYVDDIKLPGMLFGAFVRSPYAPRAHQVHRQEQGAGLPGVVAVLTADDLKPVNLHWMPTLGGDVQAVLADEKVCFQTQEVAMVHRRATATPPPTASTLVEVDYEELPAIVDPNQGDGRRRAGHPRGHRRQERSRPRPAHAPEPHLHLGSRRQGRHRRGVRQRRGDGARGDPEPARAPLPARDLRLRRVVRQGHRPAHGLHDRRRRRTWCAPWSRCSPASPRARSASSAATSAAASATRCRVYPGYVVRDRRLDRHRRAGQVDRGSRIDNISTTGFARDYHGVGELAADKDGRIKALRFTALADHGAFNSHVLDPTKFPAGLFSICTGSYDIPNAYCRGRRASTPTRRPAASPTAARCA